MPLMAAVCSVGCREETASERHSNRYYGSVVGALKLARVITFFLNLGLRKVRYAQSI
ncbi:Hypothetical protein ETEE_3265 [Edwardsiella anguillarum ET080813]|uniref:Uncharacterized protein n=1 Tax=Edwardsiella anguillarum ET080813 TaxID=667120 RepID=A0A076LW14_9GAMM|nr:Hypothetical protein ETEE_3265 [Edwardsiella anguillarum ET080813]